MKYQQCALGSLFVYTVSGSNADPRVPSGKNSRTRGSEHCVEPARQLDARFAEAEFDCFTGLPDRPAPSPSRSRRGLVGAEVSAWPNLDSLARRDDAIPRHASDMMLAARSSSKLVGCSDGASSFKICGMTPSGGAPSGRSAFGGSAVDVRDGFIHFSTAEQLAETAAEHFAGRADLRAARRRRGGARRGAALRAFARRRALPASLRRRCPLAAVRFVEPMPLGADGIRPRLPPAERLRSP